MEIALKKKKNEKMVRGGKPADDAFIRTLWCI
jgi:hypothetical protein